MGVVMSFPAALTVVPLHGQILKANASSTPASGTVSFRIEQHLRDTTDNVLLAPTTLTATLDDAGEFTISLPATDDPDVTPQGWTYVVTIATDAIQDTWRISVPAATVGTLELADVAPAITPPALVTYLLASTVGQVGGPAGPLDSGGLIPSAQIPGGGGGGPSPSGTVASGTSFGASPSAGAASTYSRGDHAHGTPTAPTAASVGADVSGAAASAVSTHVAASDPHGDRAAASGALTTHTGATDPHADRAYTDTAVASKPGLASTTPAASAVGDAGAIGAGTTAARADHVHGREAFGATTAQTTYGASSANGSASTLAHSDHTHGTPALTSSAPGNSAVGDSAAVGAAAAPAKADHTHGREGFGAVTGQTTYGASSANGSASTVAHSDHVHGTPALTVSAATVSAVGDSAAAGSATTPSHADHVHGREAFGNVTALTAFNTSSAIGSASTVAHSDHVHGAPAIVAGDVPDLSATYTTRAREGAASGVATLDSSGLVAAAQANAGEFYPADHGLLGWAFDVSTTLAGSAILTGQVVLIAVKVPKVTTISTLYIDLTSGGTSLTNCAAGLYDSSGTLRGSTADQSTSWQSGGLKTMSLSTPYTSAPAGRYWVGLLIGTGSTTPPNVGRASSQTGMPNLNLTAATIRYGVAPGTVLSALPSSFTPSGIGTQNIAWWAAIS
jgi:hypothetical protein